MDGMLAFAFGLLFAVPGCRAFYRYLRLNLIGERISGTVIRLQWEDKRVGRFCHPILEFKTLDGRNIQAKAGVGRGNVIAQPGEKVPVIYDPGDPTKAEINTAAGRAPLSRAFIAMLGIALIFLGLFKDTVERTLDGTPVLFIVGVSFAVAGGFGIRYYHRLNRTGERACGTVSELRWKDTGDGRTCYPVVAFQTLDGQNIKAETGIGTNIGTPGIGERISVVYDPRNPSRPEIATRAKWAVWVFIIPVILGIAMICYGFFSAIGGKS